METYRNIIEQAHANLLRLSEPEVNNKPAPGKWSKKEILGHLCDSCFNNYYRFMHLQHSKEPFVLTHYQQDEWVRIRDYQNQPWQEIVTQWHIMHQALLKVLNNSLEQNSKLPVFIDGARYDYQFLAEDYFVHLQHHLDQIIGHS